MKRVATLAAVALLLVGCGSSEPSMDDLAKKYKMSEDERLAFEACDKRLRQVKPILKFSGKEQMMSNVPAEVCACQARTMATVFKPEKYNSLTGFGLWLAKADKKKKPGLIKIDLKAGLSSENASRRLIGAFESCSFKYVADNKGSEDFDKFLQPPPPPKKKKGEKDKEKQASAG